MHRVSRASNARYTLYVILRAPVRNIRVNLSPGYRIVNSYLFLFRTFPSDFLPFFYPTFSVALLVLRAHTHTHKYVCTYVRVCIFFVMSLSPTPLSPIRQVLSLSRPVSLVPPLLRRPPLSRSFHLFISFPLVHVLSGTPRSACDSKPQDTCCIACLYPRQHMSIVYHIYACVYIVYIYLYMHIHIYIYICTLRYEQFRTPINVQLVPNRRVLATLRNCFASICGRLCILYD